MSKALDTNIMTNRQQGCAVGLKRPRRLLMPQLATSLSLAIVVVALQQSAEVRGFLSPSPLSQGRPLGWKCQPAARVASSPSALSVWWFGGTETVEQQLDNGDSCELVGVRIERPTSNSRRIFGDIVAPVALEDVWAILTDYNRLSTHVPNLVESKIVQRLSNGEPGDGQFQCRLFQKGAQKIVGFEFGASVTMDMREMIVREAQSAPAVVASVQPDFKEKGPRARGVVKNQGPTDSGGAHVAPVSNGGERKISFKCHDSFFFTAFDGEWTVNERIGDDGNVESVISYSVLVQPKGPVPVAALEWQIREEVPTNLRAVKKAAMTAGKQGVLAAKPQRPRVQQAAAPVAAVPSVPAKSNGALQQKRRSGLPQPVLQQQRRLVNGSERLARATGRLRDSIYSAGLSWEKDETMAAYLTEQQKPTQNT